MLTISDLTFPAGIYLAKTNDENPRTMRKVRSKLTIKIPIRRKWCRSGVYIVNIS